MTRWLFVRKPTIKNIMHRTESKSWPGKNVIAPRTPRFSNHVVKGGMKTTGRFASSQRAYCQQNKEHIRNYQRQYCKNNRERINEYWRSYYAKNMDQIRQRLRDQKQRKVGQNIVRIGAWDQESEKLETSLVPSDTLCETPTVKS